MKAIKSTCLLAAAALFVSPPAFSETLTWGRGPGGCTFMEGKPLDRNSFVLRECTRGGERLIKPVAVVFLSKGIVAMEMPRFASSYNGLWCSRGAPEWKSNHGRTVHVCSVLPRLSIRDTPIHIHGMEFN